MNARIHRPLRGRSPSLSLLLLFLGCMAPGFTARAGGVEPVDTTYLWTGTGQDGWLYTPENWQDGNAPTESTEATNNTILKFGDTRRTFIQYYDLYAKQIIFEDFSQPYFLQATYGTTAHIGSGGILYNPAHDLWSFINDNIALHASQTWAVNNGTLVITGTILALDSGDYTVEKTGAGTLYLENYYGGTSNWEGGFTLSDGLVIANADYDDETGSLSDVLGYGPLTFNGGALLVQGNFEYGAVLSNDIVSKGTVSLYAEDDLFIANENGGTVRLDADTTFDIIGGPVYIEHDITESGGSRHVTIDSTGGLILTGESDWTGGTQVDRGILIFGGDNNLPESGSITVGDDGYVGIGADNDVSEFVSKIDTAGSTGTIGFDSDPESGIPDSFTGTIDLTGANGSLRIGTATSAILGDHVNFATSTEQILLDDTAGYRFGGGGGSLYVASLLSNGEGPRTLALDSPDALPLTVWLLNPNNHHHGDVYVNNSALIYGPAAIPDAEADIITTPTGYVGTANPDMTIGNWLAYFSDDTAGIIGFDIFPGDETPEPWVIDGLDTGRFTDAVIGTATFVRDTYGDVAVPGLTLTGEITPNSDGTHRFAAYKGGAMQVSGTLTGDRLILGTPDTIATFGDRFSEEYSTILVDGENSGRLADGVTFYSGRLMVGQNNGTLGHDSTTALGEGTLTIAPLNYTDVTDGEPLTPQLAAAADYLIIPNDIVIDAPELGIGGNRDFTLAGDISGPGGLYVGEDSYGFALTLSGDNSFAGGVYLAGNSVLHVYSDTGTGAGPLGLGYGGGSVYFHSQNPVLHGFAEGDGSYADINLPYEGDRTLTIDQEGFAQFYGIIYGGESSTIIKEGPGTLRFDSNSSVISDGIADGGGNNISLEIKEGAVIFGNGAYLSGGTARLSGGTLAVDGGTTFDNPVIVEAGGRLAGFGTYTHDISIGAGAILSPGLAGFGMTGLLTFHHLELDAGGIYEYNLQSPDFADYIGRDIISVHNPDEGVDTLVINADASDPFIIRVISLDETGHAGMLQGIDQEHGTYSWTLISFDWLEVPGNDGNFDASLFQLDLGGFSSDAPFGGYFDISLSGNNIMLNFTPVPEPSTYALLALGLGIVAWSLWRRRRA